MTPRNSRPRNGLLTHQDGGPAAHKLAVRKAQAAEALASRRAKAWKLYITEGVTFVELGKRLGVSNKTAWEDVMFVYRAIQASPASSTAALRGRQQAILDKVISTHLPRRSSNASATTILNALNREARLHGLDKTLPAGYSLEQVLTLVRRLTTAFHRIIADTELRRQFAEELRRTIPAPVLQKALQAGDETEKGVD